MAAARYLNNVAMVDLEMGNTRQRKWHYRKRTTLRHVEPRS